MGYKVTKNNSDNFWEDNKNNSFGLDNKLIITLNKNVITVEGHGADAYIWRDNKKAKISNDEKIVKGIVKNGDKLFLGDEVIVEFFLTKHNLNLPKINWNLWIGVIILLSLAVIIFTGWKRTVEIKTENEYQKNLTIIKDKISKSDELKSIDPETSLKLLSEAKNNLPLIKINKKHITETNEIEKQIEEKMAISGSTEVVGFSDIYNAKTADAVDRNYDKMAVSGNLAVLTEIKTGKIILVNLDSGKVDKFEVNKEITNIIDVIFANKNIFIYDGKDIWDIKNNKVAQIGDEVFTKVLNWNSSWYLLGQDGKIKKFNDNKISNWTSDSATLINKPVGMAIDATVWVVDGGGNVANYEKGINKKWASSINIANEKIIGITTTADSNKVAIISDKKVYIFEKNGGKLMATHNFEKIGIIEAKMGNNEQIYVLGQDQKIYKVK